MSDMAYTVGAMNSNVNPVANNDQGEAFTPSHLNTVPIRSMQPMSGKST